jgi:type I restriction enzyme S subunit
MNRLPSAWKPDRLKDRVRFAYGDSLAAEDRNAGDVKVFGSNGVVGVHDRAITNGRTIVIGRKGSFGKVTWSDDPCFPIDTTFFVDSTQTKVELRWLYYALDNLQLDTVNFDSAVPGLSREVAYSLPMIFPPLPEQQRIAAYLDASCAAIDAAVSAKRRQLETLDELRNSIISRAVTRGLNPQAKMKSSGLDWLSDVPAHWRVQQIKRACSLVRGQFTHRPRNDPALYDGPYPFVQTGDITAAGNTSARIRKPSTSLA